MRAINGSSYNCKQVKQPEHEFGLILTEAEAWLSIVKVPVESSKVGAA